MKIAMVNKWDKGGVAARVAWRLFVALRNAGEDVQYVVHDKTDVDERVVKIEFSRQALCYLFGLMQ